MKRSFIMLKFNCIKKNYLAFFIFILCFSILGKFSFAVTTQIEFNPQEPNKVVEDANFLSLNRYEPPEYGKYKIPSDNKGEINMFLIIPNNNGKSWAQGDIKIYNEYGKEVGKETIGNFSGSFIRITWKDLKPGESYYFSYGIHSIKK